MAPFTFPPPPPPPPTQQQPPPPALGNSPSYASHNAYSHRGSYRGTGGGYRGRGRGGMTRGGRAYPNSYSNSNPQGIYGGGGYSTVPVQSPDYYRNNSYSTSSYSPLAQGYASQPYTSSSTATVTAPAYPHTNYNGSYGNTQAPANGPASSYSAGSAGLSSNNVVAPPMHWNVGSGGFYPGSANGTPFQTGPYQGPTTHANTHYGGSQKRAFSSAFGKPVSQAPRVAAPPAVPSFGVPLPAKPPQSADTSRKAPKKKKRKFNQLGLTPKSEEHESSAEEDDVDEESRLAAAGGSAPTGPIQITYRGRTATLSTATDIQAWIAERKKRFPTEARVEEKKKAQEEAKKQRELQREEARRKQMELREQAKAKHKEAPSSNAVDVAIKAKAKAEKLRKKLLKEERRLQKAEADAEKARLVAEASQQPSDAGATSIAEVQSTGGKDQGNVDQIVQNADDVSSQTNFKISVKEEPSLPMLVHNRDIGGGSLSSISDTTTSSEDEDGEDDDDDDDDDDDEPEEISSRRDGPQRVPPPPREGNAKSSKPCRDFQRKGKCPRGAQCRFSHEPRPKQQHLQQQSRQPAKRGLYQMLVAQTVEEENRQVMQAISWLGSQGLLEETEPLT